LKKNLRGLNFEPHDTINDKWVKVSQGIHKVASEVVGNKAGEHHNATDKLHQSLCGALSSGNIK
jgi:hypothetical protein